MGRWVDPLPIAKILLAAHRALAVRARRVPRALLDQRAHRLPNFGEIKDRHPILHNGLVRTVKLYAQSHSGRSEQL